MLIILKKVVYLSIIKNKTNVYNKFRRPYRRVSK